MSVGTISIQSYVRPWQEVLEKAQKDPSFRQQLLNNTINVMQDFGIKVDQPDFIGLVESLIRRIVLHPGFDQAQPGRVAAAVTMPYAIGEEVFQASLPAQPDERLLTADNYITCDARPWGLVFTLSNQAVSDLAAGYGIAAGIAAAAAAVLGGAGQPAPAAVAALVSAFLAISAGVVTLMNRGKGVYLTVPWTSFSPLPPPLGTPGLVIPTPVT